jgi:transcriptional regulator
LLLAAAVPARHERAFARDLPRAAGNAPRHVSLKSRDSVISAASFTGAFAMYAQPAFRIDQSASLAFADARGFGLVVGVDNGRPMASTVPFLLEPADAPVRLQFHVARGNPLGKLAEHGGTWLMSVQGHDAYVSPDWYESAEQVPTWLYELVHLSGPVSVIPPERMVAHLEKLSAKFEERLLPKKPWLLDKVSPQRQDMLKRAIVGIEMQIETIDGSFKLNQHKPDADYVGTARALKSLDDAAAAAIARRMMATKPQLSYD